MDFCSDYHFLQALLTIKVILIVGMIAIPGILVAIGTYDCFKLLTRGKADVAKERAMIFLKRICSVLIIFMMPTVIATFVKLVGNEWIINDISTCYTNAASDTIKELKRASSDLAKEGLDQGVESYYSTYLADKKTDTSSSLTSSTTSIDSTSSSTTSNATGKGNFIKYDLTDEQIAFLANVAMNEKGNPKGACAEASFMANLFEQQGSKYGSGGDGLVNYVKNGGWWNSKSITKQRDDVTDEVKSKIKKVLVEGKRTIPAYIVSHNCIDCNSSKKCSNGRKGDICSATNDGVEIDLNDRSAYIPNKTIIKSVYGSTNIYWGFPDDSKFNGPFSYKSEELRAKLGDDYYAYEDL